MATSSSSFCSEIWSQKILKTYEQELERAMRPQRSWAAQMLRDAAFGHPEYEKTYTEITAGQQKTATEVRIQHEQMQHQLDAMAYSVATSVFLRKGSG